MTELQPTDWILPFFVIFVAFLAGIGYSAGCDAWRAIRDAWRRWQA